jgi:hypothetical protein
MVRIIEVIIIFGILRVIKVVRVFVIVVGIFEVISIVRGTKSVSGVKGSGIKGSAYWVVTSPQIRFGGSANHEQRYNYRL